MLINLLVYTLTSFISVLTVSKVMISRTYSTVPVGSVLMRATLVYSDSTFRSIFEADVNLRKCGHARGRAADERLTLWCGLLVLLRITKHLESLMCNVYRRPDAHRKT